MGTYRKKLIEVALPLESINAAAVHEKAVRVGHPANLHPWWARRPLAAARAILFAQLVDDPSSWPSVYPDEASQDRERSRLFGVLTELVDWEKRKNARCFDAARLEIAMSLARAREASGTPLSETEDRILARGANSAEVRRYLSEVAPLVHDPFAGGGAIPIEAQRLGLPTKATDLNPIPVLLNLAATDFPQRFLDISEVNPIARRTPLQRSRGPSGLAADVSFYARWLQSRAMELIGHHFPPVAVGRKEKRRVVAWIWARTVPSPDPSMNGAAVPLVRSYWLSKKKESKTWMVPVIDSAAHTWRMEMGLVLTLITAAE